MTPHRIAYRLLFPDGTCREFHLACDPQTLEVIDAPGERPGWTRLDFCKCSNCPLEAEATPHYPAAVALLRFVDACTDLVSHQPVRLTVSTPERSIAKETRCSAGSARCSGC
jgi:hypothetical protein